MSMYKMLTNESKLNYTFQLYKIVILDKKFFFFFLLHFIYMFDRWTHFLLEERRTVWTNSSSLKYISNVRATKL